MLYHADETFDACPQTPLTPSAIARASCKWPSRRSPAPAQKPASTTSLKKQVFGALYRRFPIRDALLEAVYRTELEKLAAAERRIADSMPLMEALRAWMLLFVDYIATKKIIATALNALAGGPSKVAHW